MRLDSGNFKGNFSAIFNKIGFVIFRETGYAFFYGLLYRHSGIKSMRNVLGRTAKILAGFGAFLLGFILLFFGLIVLLGRLLVVLGLLLLGPAVDHLVRQSLRHRRFRPSTPRADWAA